jgi:hypothetical protein
MILYTGITSMITIHKCQEMRMMRVDGNKKINLIMKMILKMMNRVKEKHTGDSNKTGMELMMMMNISIQSQC